MGELNEWGKSIGRVVGDFISPGYAQRERDREFGNKSSNDDDDDDSPYDSPSNDDDE